MAEAILLPPGRIQELTCDSGTVAKFPTGSTIQPQADGGGVFVILNDGNKILLGPMKAGVFELPALCKGSEETVSLEVVAPNPPQGPVQYKAMNSAEMAYPLWMWIALGLALLLICLSPFLVSAFRKRKRRGERPSVLRMRKPIEVRMKSFLAEMNAKKVALKDDKKAVQSLYSEGIQNLRRLIQKSLGFKAPGATLKEFPVEVKSRLRSGKLSITQQDVARLEALFSQAFAVVYSQEVPAESSRVAFLKSLGDFYTLFAENIARRTEKENSQKKKKFSLPGKSKVRSSSKKAGAKKT